MSHALINRSPDLKRLRDEGYFVQIRGGFLVMREVPYVDAGTKVQRGTLISSLTMAGVQQVDGKMALSVYADVVAIPAFIIETVPSRSHDSH